MRPHSTLRALSALVLFSSLAAAPVQAQTVVVPSAVTASVGPFDANVSLASNLTLGVTTATTAATTFPYAQDWSANGIGYISAADIATGSITYTFPQDVSISQMMIWNAYFDFELDHSSKDVVLEFRDATNALITSTPATLPIADASVLTAYVLDLGNEVLGVRSVTMTVSTLWGGNEISIRRIAFAGRGLNVGVPVIADAALVAPAYPLPANDRVTLPMASIRTVVVLDELGRTVPAEVRLSTDRAELVCTGVGFGTYFAIVTTADRTLRYRLVLGVK